MYNDKLISMVPLLSFCLYNTSIIKLNLYFYNTFLKKPMVKIRSPGPRYALPTTTGFIKHDITRTQAPAVSFGVVTKGKLKSSVPGPKYNVRGMNEHGQLTSQHTSILGRWAPTKITRTPGPKSYDTKIIEPTAPAFSFGNKRLDLRRSKLGPGPNKYAPPTCIGPNIPDKKAEPAYSMLSRNVPKVKRQTPGPKYMLPAPSVYLKTPPRVALLGRQKQKFFTGVPAPNKYKPKQTYEKGEASKGITFGVKHSYERFLVYLPEDKAEDVFVF